MFKKDNENHSRLVMSGVENRQIETLFMFFRHPADSVLTHEQERMKVDQSVNVSSFGEFLYEY